MAGIPQVITEDRASGAQVIDGSLTINGSNQYLTRTHTASNTKTWTFSCWVKKQRNGAYHQLFTGFETGANQSGIIFMNDDTLQIYSQGGLSMTLKTSAVYRDSGWMNVVVAVDTTQSTTADRVKLWVNGTRVTSFGTATYPSQNDETYINTNIAHYVGSNQPSSNTFYGQYTQAYFIEGQALGPEEFGFTDPLTNTWRPKKYGGDFKIIPDNQLLYNVNTGDNGFDSGTSSRTYDATGRTFATYSTPQTANPGGFGANSAHVYKSPDGAAIDWVISTDTTDRYIWTSTDGVNWTNTGVQDTDGSPQTVNTAWLAMAGGSNVSNVTVTSSTAGYGSIVGHNSFYLPLDGNTLIGKDQSGNGNDWTPRGFGGSVELPKATGAIPILNTNEAGTVAKRGVRTDSKTYTVTASGGNYYLDGALKPTLNAYRGGSYTFDYTGATSHPFYLSSLPDGKHNSKAYSVEFDGANQYLTHPNDDTITDWSSGDYTIELWAYFDSFAVGSNNNTHLIGAAAIDSGSESWSLGPNSSGEVVWYYWNGSQQRVTGGTITTGRWYHLAMTHSGGVIRIFIDGNLSTTGSVSGTPQISTLPLRIGKLTSSSSFDGYVSNVRIVRGSAVYTSNFTPPQTTLTNITNTTFLACQDSNAATATVAPGTITATGAAASQTRQPFLYDNNHGNFGVNTATSNTTKITIPHTAADTLYYYCSAHSGMGSSINVTTDIRKADPYAWKCVLALPMLSKEDVSASINVNSTTKATSITGNAEARSERWDLYGGAFYFDSSNDWIQATPTSGSTLANGSGPYTIEFFFSINSGRFSDNVYNILFTTSSGLTIAKWRSGVSNKVYFESDGNATGWSVQTVDNISANTWYHFAAVRDGNTIRTYLDGVLQGTATATYTAGAETYWRIGDNGNGQTHAGYMQDLRIYNGVAKYSEDFLRVSTTPDILPDTPSGVSGKSKLTKITDGAVSFDGSGDYLNASAILPTSTGTAFVVDCFWYSNGNSSQKGIWEQHSGGSGRTGYFANNGSAYLVSEGNTVGTFTYEDKRWYFTRIIYDGSGNIYHYVDGALIGSGTQSSGIDDTGFQIGAYSTDYFNGFISNFRIVVGSNSLSGTDVPTAPLTNITNTKLLCCQSTTSASAATVAPGTFVNDGTNYSSDSQVTGSAGLTNVNSIFDGHLRASGNPSLNEGATVSLSSDNYILWTPTTGIPYSSKVEVYCYAANGYEITNYYTFNGGTETTFTGGASNFNGNAWITVATGSGTINSIKIRITRGSGNQTQVNWYAVKVDGTILINDYNGKSIGKYDNTAATNFNPFTDDINTIRGQETGYATFNPILKGANTTLSKGNLTVSSSGGTTAGWATGTIPIPKTGKWFVEFTAGSIPASTYYGMYNTITWNPNDFTGTGFFGLQADSGNKFKSAGASAYMSAASFGDVIGVMYDADNNTLGFMRNGINYGVAFDSSDGIDYTDEHRVWWNTNGATTFTHTINFGQKPFKFPPPDGFQPLNLSTVQPEKVIARPDQYVDVSLWSGNGTSQSITGLKHKPDFVWLKKRSGGSARSHQLFDTVRGVHKSLHSDSTNSEDTNTSRLTAFNQDGFTVGGDDGINGSGGEFVAWTWKAGGNKNTFNIDDVGYANAANAKMSIGSLNNDAYDQSQRWRDNITSSNGWNTSYPINRAFNGSFDGGGGAANNGGGGTITFTPPAAITVTKLELSIYSDVTLTLPDGTTQELTGVGSADRYVEADIGSGFSFTGSNSITISRTSSFIYLERIKINGRELVDDDITPTNVPSIAATGSSVGTKQGFSIIKWTGDGSDANRTVPHGLLEAPSFIIVKPLTESRHWLIWHKDYNDDDAAMLFDTGIPAGSRFGPNAPTSNVFGVYGGQGNRGTTDFIGYCWHDVPGLQKFGIYSGNGTSEGPFVELGFQPAIIWMKNISNGSNRQWCVVDSTRSTYNKSASSEVLFPNSNQVESYADNAFGQFGSKPCVDILSNGFKLRESNTTGVYTQVNNTHDYIYCAWAEAPTLNLYGAQSNAF